MPWGPRCAPQPVAVGRDPPRTRENTASQGPLSTARARRGRFLGSGTHVKIDGKTRGKPQIRPPKPLLRPKRETRNVDFPTVTLTLGPPEAPPGPPHLYAYLRRFGTPGPQKPRVLMSGSKTGPPAASGLPPAASGASWRPPGHPPRPGSQSERLSFQRTLTDRMQILVPFIRLSEISGKKEREKESMTYIIK